MEILEAFLIFGLIGMFVVVGWWDHRARKRGHRLRSASDIRIAERDVRRNVDAARELLGNPADLQWGTPDEQRYGQSRWQRGD